MPGVPLARGCTLFLDERVFGDEERAPAVLREVRRMQRGLSTMVNALRAFGRYVPSELVREVLAMRRGAELGVAPCEATIALLDLASFTSVTEQLGDDELVQYLRPWFEGMCSILRSHEAAIDKYVGDSIQALWNAPTEVADHPVRACEAALACRDALGEIRERLAHEGLPPMHARIGVHTGLALVGNLGAAHRLNFTIIGTPALVVASLEAANKRYGTQILISTAVFAAVSHAVVCRPIDRLQLASRRRAELIYEPLMMRNKASVRDLALVDATRRAYALRARNRLDEAADAYEELAERFDGAAAQVRVHARDDFSWAERLAYVIVGAEFQAQDSVQFFHARRDQNHWNVREVA